MEESRKWTIAVLAFLVIGVIIFATVGYLLLVEDEGAGRESSTISIVGTDLATSDLVDHGTGTLSDPYVITDLDVPVWGSQWGDEKCGIVVQDVDDYLVLSGSRIYGMIDLNDGSIPVGIWLLNSQHVTILDCRFENLSRGVQLESCKDINITVNHFTECSFGVILQPYHSDDVSVYDNWFDEVGYGTYAAGWENGVGCSNLAVRMNDFSHVDHALWADKIVAVAFTNNTADFMDVLVLYLSSCDDATVKGNSVNGFFEPGSAGFSFYDVSSAEVSDNIVTGFVDHGIRMLQSNAVTISDNFMQAGTCISVRGSLSVDVERNTIQSSDVGIWVADSESVNITRCDLSGFVGVQLLTSGDNTTKAMIHHNNFWNCGIPAIDNSGSANTWDDGVGAGNFWGDHYSGSDGDSDGIGDTPFEIDQDSSDRYPLMMALVQN